MILNTYFLNQRLSVESQEQEISRIQNAPSGTVLFSANTWENSDVIETLLERSKVRFLEYVRGGTVRWVKD